MSDASQRPPAQQPSTQAKPKPQGAPTSASPESLDQVIETTRTHGWWALWAIAAAVVLATVWACVAEIPQQNSATGVVSTLTYSKDISAPASGILTFKDILAQNAKAGDEIGQIQPYNEPAPVPIYAPMDSNISAIYVANGEGVEAGQVLARATQTPDPTEGILVATFLPASEALTYFPGETAEVSVTDLSLSQSVVVTGVIQNVSDTPSNVQAMTNMSGSPALAQKWLEQANGTPYRILLLLKDWPATDKSLIPAAGQLVNIVHTYGTVHPIQLLFGGG